ncbi:hypothetical protein EWB00_007719 [Schistosoma japonicum]|uniref:Uncharacterized protein n=1 Tax=Schistosoma japonicum TaxID=6182 RepID=A0A4Z2DTE9_SCHJA|nr:hypothetical protein EWB00_007719 [Schistosoma japonicum]
MPPDKRLCKLTVINTPFGIFGCKFPPSAIFQELINLIIDELEGVESYQEAITTNATNSIYFIDCPGHTMNVNGYKPDMNRLMQLIQAPSPTDKFIPNFMQLLALFFDFVFDVESRLKLVLTSNPSENFTQRTMRKILNHAYTVMDAWFTSS